MSTMIEKGITNRGPKKRDPICLQTLADIVIPAGTILRQEPGKPDTFRCSVGAVGTLSVAVRPGEIQPLYKRVIA